ncbi:MAG: hypothetical protein FWE37_08535 [Spirochaetaceae bacterium]|nr:hypothetical protein [Spirochaetaceae bacterium]
MPNNISADCPCCYTKAVGRKEIEEKFGFRNDGKVPQSYCKECRVAKCKTGEPCKKNK